MTDLNSSQKIRLYQLTKIEGIHFASYIGEGLFTINDGEIDLSLSEKDTDWVLNGITLTRGNSNGSK